MPSFWARRLFLGSAVQIAAFIDQLKLRQTIQQKVAI